MITLKNYMRNLNIHYQTINSLLRTLIFLTKLEAPSRLTFRLLKSGNEILYSAGKKWLNLSISSSLSKNNSLTIAATTGVVILQNVKLSE